MKGGNEFSKNALSPQTEAWIVKLHQSLVLKDYGLGTLKNYTAEMTLLFKYHWQKPVEDIRQGDVEQ